MQVSMDLELERRLEAFARVRLGPTQAATARMRARVMREARLAMADRASLATVPTAVMVAGHRPRARLVRRGAGLLLAAGLTLGVAGGAMAAAQPGGPLYPTRVWLETLALPSGGAARSDADIERLNARLQEVLAAAARGDRAGVAAALTAYQEIAEEALLAATGDASAIDRLRAVLDRHVDVLASVVTSVPLQARDAIQRNIERAIQGNSDKLDRIDDKQPGGPAVQPGPAPEPAPPVKPEKTPKPTDPPASGPTEPAPTAHPTAPAVDPPKTPPSPKPDKTPPRHGRSQAP